MATFERAAFFIDGNNFYHSLRGVGVGVEGLDHLRVCDKLRQARSLAYVGYYIGRLAPDAPHYGNQRRLFHQLRTQGINVVEGRIEKRPAGSALSDRVNELLAWLTKNVSGRMDRPLYNILRQRVADLVDSYVWVEKAVDVHIAVDMVGMARRDEYDVGYLLSADGDYTPVAAEVRRLGKKVFAVSPSHGNELSKAVDLYIHLRPDWFQDCMTR